MPVLHPGAVTNPRRPRAAQLMWVREGTTTILGPEFMLRVLFLNSLCMTITVPERWPLLLLPRLRLLLRLMLLCRRHTGSFRRHRLL